MKQNRIEWIDIARGIGILLVIIGHCVNANRFIFRWIFSFHMQLFFFLSGLVYKEDKFGTIIKKKFRQLILPYCYFCIIGLVISLIIPQWRKFSKKVFLQELYCAYPNSLHVSSIWFLTCLFITIIYFTCILFVLRKSKILGIIFFFTLVLLGFAFGRFSELRSHFPYKRLPVNTDCALVSVLFFGLSYLLEDKIKSFAGSVEKNTIDTLLGIVISLGITVLITNLNGKVNLRDRSFHNEIYYTLGSIAGFSFVLFLSLFLERINIIKQGLLWFGKNSLKIIGTQAIVIRLYVLLVNRFTGNQFRLYKLPPEYAIPACVLVTMFSGLSVTLFNLVRNKLSYCNYH